MPGAPDHGILKSGNWDHPWLFEFPAEVDADNIRARLEYGVLKVRIPKAAAARPKLVKVSADAEPGGERENMRGGAETTRSGENATRDAQTVPGSS